MTPKEQAAMQKALEALELHLYGCGVAIATRIAYDALREALDHSGEANEMVIGWDRVKPEAIASDPLYQQGFVDGVEEGRNQVAEQAEQERKYGELAGTHNWTPPNYTDEQWQKLDQEYRDHVTEQAQQEPVARSVSCHYSG